MALNDDLIKKILTKLNDIYPKDIEKMKEILPDYEDQEEVCLHLFHLKDMNHVDFIDLSSKDGKACCNIKTTPKGIGYLKSLNLTF